MLRSVHQSNAQQRRPYPFVSAQALREAVKSQMHENSDSATHAASGRDWVRGWDDWKKEGPEPGPAAS